ncbi:MAG: DUF6089 family protein [Bacteroidota bacterium]
MQYKKLILSCFLSIGLLSFAYAQRAEIGVNAGGAGYIGDLNQFNPLKISGLNGGIYGKINFDPYWGLGFHYNYGQIKAEDVHSNNLAQQQRNLNFKTSLNELAFIGSFNFFDMYSPGSRKRVTPFVFAGGGGVIFKTVVKYNGEWQKDVVLRKFMTEGQADPYRNYSPVVIYGAGVKYKKDENWTLFGQIGYRTTFTDYLDDVSGVYPLVEGKWGGVNLSDRSGEVSSSGVGIFKPGDQRGDFRKRDTYLFVNIGISYTFVSQKCFTF